MSIHGDHPQTPASGVERLRMVPMINPPATIADGVDLRDLVGRELLALVDGKWLRVTLVGLVVSNDDRPPHWPYGVEVRMAVRGPAGDPSAHRCSTPDVGHPGDRWVCPTCGAVWWATDTATVDAATISWGRVE